MNPDDYCKFYNKSRHGANNYNEFHHEIKTNDPRYATS